MATMCYLQCIIVFLFVFGGNQTILCFLNKSEEFFNDSSPNDQEGQIRIYNGILDTTDIPDIANGQNWREQADILCPYYRLCSNTTSNSIPPLSGTNGSCCLQRKCSNTCFGPNYGHRKECVSMASQCKNQAELFNITRGLQQAHPVQYYIIDTCIESFNHREIVNDCRYPKELHDFVLVIDEENNIYKNGKCAQCNNVSEYNYWELVVHANATLIDLNLDEISKQVLSEGKWYSRAPGNIDQYRVDMNRCFPEAVSTCNETGMWDTYDSDLDKACKTAGPTYYYGMFIWFHVIYSNVFCFLCNQKTSSVVQKDELCRNDPNLFSSYGSGLTFEMILNVVRIHSLLYKRETPDLCGINEIWDRNMMTCRVFTCPIGSREVFGVCHTDVLYTEGQPIKFTLAMKPGTTISYMDKGRKFFGDLYAVVTQELQLDFQGTRCTIYSLEFYRHNQTGDLFLELTVLTGLGCNESDISSAVFRLLEYKDVTVKFRYDFKTIQYKVNLIFDYLNPEQRISMLSRKKVVRCCSNADDLYLHARFYCPSIQLNETDLDKIEELFGTNIKDDIYQRSDVGIGHGILYDDECYKANNCSSTYRPRICFDEYVAAFEPKTSFPEQSERGMISIGTRNRPMIVSNALLFCFSGLFYVTFMWI